MVWYGMYIYIYVCMYDYVCTYVRTNEYYESYVINTFLTHLKQFCLHEYTGIPLNNMMLGPISPE
jgi:hypothetical protein